MASANECPNAFDAAYVAWSQTFEAWKAANPQLAAELAVSRAYSHTIAADTKARTPDEKTLLGAIPEFAAGTNIATRKAGQEVLQPLSAKVPLLVGGSADLYGSTLNYIGKMGEDAAAAIADFVVVDMFADYCTGRSDVKTAMASAERNAKRIFR